MKIIVKGIVVICLMIAFLVGCSSTDSESTPQSKEILALNWQEIKEKADGATVNFFMWGGDKGINKYIDEWVAPRLKEEFNVELKRYPMDATEFISKLVTEKRSNVTEGQMDIIWINGENFKTAKENSLLLGPITSILPNFQQYVDGDSPNVMFDFGYPTDGYEAPWGKVQFVFAYDSSKVHDPPATIAELCEWIKEHPGKFTYPAPPDFTGSAFIRHVLYETSGNMEDYLGKFDESLIEKDAEQLWTVLNEMKPYLWREGKSYPQSLAQLEQLYKNGEVWMTMGYDEANASNLIVNGEFPDTTRTFVLENGTLSNTHFLAVPFNSPNPHGAVVAINYLLSPAAQLKKMDVQYWGENTSLDVSKLPDKYKKILKEIDRGPATLSEEVLSEHRLPEINAEYAKWLERGWMENVSN